MRYISKFIAVITVVIPFIIKITPKILNLIVIWIKIILLTPLAYIIRLIRTGRL
tara:strand:+ start:182 stop:343 length:162 start_codon:yes stop_codon:yes gene_type:complete